MRIVVTGASGGVGTPLLAALRKEGHLVVTLVRHRAAVGEGKFFWDPADDVLDERVWSGVDAVIHLAGENLFSGRWNDPLKARIRESRVRGTALLSRSLASQAKVPSTLISASAIGFYGSRSSDAPQPEGEGAGEGFLARLCAEWEGATAPAEERGVRVIHLRIGLVLDLLLAKLLLPFRLGLGGRLGDGRQIMSWISMADLAGVILYLLDHNSSGMSGPVNAVSPMAVSNREFTRILGAALCRPAILPVPAGMLRLLLGREMADETLLSSIHALPEKLTAAGYPFRHPELDDAIQNAID